MDAKTLEALKASIAKWERNAEAETPEQYLTGSTDCPLCNLFANYETAFDDICTSCPVFKSTLKDSCGGTPYIAAYKAKVRWEGGGRKSHAHEAARAEVAFLKSLLPAESPQ